MNWLRSIARRARRSVLDRVLERSGETSDAVRLGDLGIAERDYHDYEPSGWRTLQRGLRGFPIGPEDAFVDIGCGKGRIVAQAARLRFGRVIGVELSPELAEQARALLAAERRRRRCGATEIVVADATTWELPDDVSYVYVYNALGGEALQAMLDRIAASAARRPRRLLLLYANPVQEQAVLDHPGFELQERRGRRRWAASDPRRISVFRVGEG